MAQVRAFFMGQRKMNIQLFNQEPAMTSREIADLLEARHDNVKVSIDRLVNSGAIQSPSVQDFKNANNVTGQEYVICKRDTYVIVAQLSPAFTARLVDRWQELEQSNKIQLPDFSNPAAAARAWADEVEAKQSALLQLEAAKPALEFVDRYVDSTGLKGFRQVAKLLNIKEPDLRAFLDDNQIMYKLAGEWVPYANHIDAGRFSVKAGTAENGHAFNSAKFTPKGIQWLAGEIAKSKVNV